MFQLKFRIAVICVFVAVFGQTLASAGSPSGKEFKLEQPILESTFPFEKGAHEIQVGVGYFTSLTPGTAERPDLDFAVVSLRHGWMLSSTRPGELSGNLEFLVDLYVAPVTNGPGNILAGGTALLRYNLVPSARKFVPYFQIGAGALYNDVYQQGTQRIIGSAFEFNLEGSLGLRYLCSDRCAVFAEAGLRHISNANTASRNNGLNSFGGVIGVSFFY